VSLGERILARLEAEPGRTLLEGDGGVHTRGAVAERARRVASLLTAEGVAPGDRVVLSLPKGPWLPACHLGTLLAGAAVVPLDPAHPDAALARLLARAEPRLAIVDPALAERGLRFAPGLAWWCPDPAPPEGARELTADGAPAARAVPRGGEDLALLAFTSGTTGSPKGVPLSHANLTSNLDALARVWGWREDDRLLHVLPVFHLHGLGVALYGSLLAGSVLVFHERFDPERVLRDAAARNASLLMAVPTMLGRLLEVAPDADNPLAGLRLVISGSAPLAPDLFERFRRRFGHAPVERYGMTETGMNASNPADGERKPGSVGPPVPGVVLRLCDPDGRIVRDEGEVCVRGPNVFAGYWRDAEATRAAFRDGWFRTGDLGRFDTDGYLVLTGRAKELIVTGGYNVSPLAVERALAAPEVPGVRELAVAGVPDADLGERVAAFVVPTDEGEADWPGVEAALRARAEAALARYSRPRTYVRLTALPRNALGKLERNRLRDAQATGEDV
jgi:malonyl-CoA/methylmalonyl-CoA synthetase